ncbi:aminoglycoside phosphotransferase family protein [Microlunatus soli]|uniref:aminoglycoside phosphotransferase family protein n=1 Tax=Microlunatus soli TaxID=630515 RepID=UPI001E48E250|nr:aminoglycoside phosphotransferase family protein [Microlunatus soli]
MAGAAIQDAVSVHIGAQRASGSFHLRMVGGDFTDLLLKVPVPEWIGPRMVATNARALQLAAEFGLSAPRLVGADLDGSASGTVATLETWLPGSSALPPAVSVTRLRNAGAALARVHAFSLAPHEDLRLRPRPVADDDFAAERRAGRMPTTGLLQRADEMTRQHGVPATDPVFVHGDAWPGNMLFEGDSCTALIDWKTAGIGDPGVDLSGFRLQMAIQYGPDAPDEVLRGWQEQAGRDAGSVSYWDAIAALNTPTELSGFPGFGADGSRLDATAVTQRRDEFLQTALNALT